MCSVVLVAITNKLQLSSCSLCLRLFTKFQKFHSCTDLQHFDNHRFSVPLPLRVTTMALQALLAEHLPSPKDIQRLVSEPQGM